MPRKVTRCKPTPHRPRNRAAVMVCMTPEQVHRQDMQVRWLELALDAKRAALRQLPALDAASLEACV